MFLIIVPQLLNLSDFNSEYAYLIPMQPSIGPILKVPFDFPQELFIRAFDLLGADLMRINHLKHKEATGATQTK
jgi:hypothetical protein